MRSRSTHFTYSGTSSVGDTLIFCCCCCYKTQVESMVRMSSSAYRITPKELDHSSTYGASTLIPSSFLDFLVFILWLFCVFLFIKLMLHTPPYPPVVAGNSPTHFAFTSSTVRTCITPSIHLSTWLLFIPHP